MGPRNRLSFISHDERAVVKLQEFLVRDIDEQIELQAVSSTYVRGWEHI